MRKNEETTKKNGALPNKLGQYGTCPSSVNPKSFVVWEKMKRKIDYKDNSRILETL